MNKSELLKNVSYNLLAEGKTIRIKAQGYSMYPAIKPGSVLLIEPLKVKGRPVAGEIVAIIRKNGLIVHRITSIIKIDGKDHYIARGDSNARADDPVNPGLIAGRVVRAETSGLNQVLADISKNEKPDYILNRIRVVSIILWKKLKRLFG